MNGNAPTVAIIEWRKGLKNKDVINMVRDLRGGNFDQANFDADDEYDARILAGRISRKERLGERCGNHRTARVKPRGCEACASKQVLVNKINFRGKGGKTEKGAC